MERKNTIVSRGFRAARLNAVFLLLAMGGKGLAQGRLDSVAALQRGGEAATTLQFAFAFPTDEEPTPRLFFNSFALMLAEANGSISAICKTMDRNRDLCGQKALETILVSRDSILRQSISFPDLNLHHTRRFTSLTTAPVPAEMSGRELSFYVDLFDNQNARQSGSITPVPEPTTWALLATALVFFFAFQWRGE